MQALSVIGLGKLGAPMAAIFAAKGFDVIGVDLDESYVRAINDGRAPVEEPSLQEYIDRGRERLRATLDYAEAVHGSEASFVIVPTPSGSDRMFTNRYVIAAVEEIGRALRGKSDYHLVVITSTVIPGSTDGEIRTALERSSGRRVGVDVGLCYNPEFIALGSVVRDMLFPDMVLIGELDQRAGDLLDSVHRRTIESHPEYHRMNLVNAELCKISVNTFVTAKISYANMIADMCDHLPAADAEVVMQAVGADSRIGHKYLKPAVGYGGPCFPRDNKALAAFGRKLGVNTALAEATDAINDHQLERLTRAVRAAATPGSTVAVLGLAYKPDTAVVEESQGLLLARWLANHGFRVIISDPMANASGAAVLGGCAEVVEDPQMAVRAAAVAVVMTPWPQFRSLDWSEGLSGRATRTVVDPWGIAETAGTEVRLIRLGRGDWLQNGAARSAVA